MTPSSCYHHVKFRIADIACIWSMATASKDQDEPIIQPKRLESESETETSRVDELAEWIFARYPSERNFEALFKQAKDKACDLCAGIGNFLKRIYWPLINESANRKASGHPQPAGRCNPKFRRRSELK